MRHINHTNKQRMASYQDGYSFAVKELAAKEGNEHYRIQLIKLSEFGSICSDDWYLGVRRACIPEVAVYLIG